MTDYNDGKWHGWNGGECPVHPDSEVCIATPIGATTSDASEFNWEVDSSNPILAFRVTKPYVDPPKPREFYLVEGCVYDNKSEALSDHLTEKHGYIHVREVIE